MNLNLTKQQADELYNNLCTYTENKTLSEIRKMIYQERVKGGNNILDKV